MTLDFDRYLSYTDPDPGSLDHKIQSAYKEWSSFCYLAYQCAAGKDQSSNCTGYSQQHHQESASLPIHQYILNKKNNEASRTRYVCTVNNNLATNNHYGSYGIRNKQFCVSEQDNMPRPPGQQFGSRLSLINGKKDSLPCPDGPLRRRKPALGVNGLKLATQPNVIVVPKSDDGLPKRRTTRFARTSLSMCRRNVTTESVIHNVNEQVRTTSSYSCDKENNVVTTNFQSVRTNHKSVVLSPVCNDVIEEVGSEEETLSEELETFTEIPVVRSRKISFADELGRSLVTCRVFERDSSDSEEEEEEASIPEVDEDTENNEKCPDKQLYYDTVDISPKRKRFNVLADEAYQSVCNDIKNVKLLLQQNREFFQNLAPQEEADVNGNKSIVAGCMSDEDCVVFPCESVMEHTSLLSQRNLECTQVSSETASKPIPIMDTTCSDEVVATGLTDQEEVTIAQTEAQINKQIKEIYDLLVDTHTSECVETDITSIRNDNSTLETAVAEKKSTNPYVICKFKNFEINPVDKQSSDLFLNSLNFVPGGHVIEGKIGGTNAHRGKKVFVRYSSDQWKSFTDVCAKSTELLSVSAEPEVDVFDFSIPLPTPASSNQDQSPLPLEFAMFCEDEEAGSRHWNNNESRNFLIEFHCRKEV